MSNRKIASQALIRLLPYLICLLFVVGYSTLSIVRHDHYQSFGYDLGINDQVVWRYSKFELPISTISALPDRSKLAAHIELAYVLVAPFYWIWNSKDMLIIVRTIWFCFSGIAVYKLARKKELKNIVSIPIVISYISFYGVQNAMWTDVHSACFAAAFLMWFIYFLDSKKQKLSLLFFILAITAKENIALLILLITFVYFIKQKSKFLLFFMLASVLYLLFVFFIYFPYIAHINYLYQNEAGLFSNLNPLSLIDTPEKIQTIWYSFSSFGFLSLLSPLHLLPVIGDLSTYFVVASDLPGAQGLFGQYRITLVPFLALATIMAIYKFRRLNNWYIGLYLLASVILAQYVLHLPLSYLTKQWFWAEPGAVKNINFLRNNFLPREASVVSQNNIIPHISHRDQVYTLYPEKKTFLSKSPCGKNICDWFRWYGNPQFLFVDTSSYWDARHLLEDREPFLRGLQNIEKTGIVTKCKQAGNAILYRVNKNPEDFKSL